MSSQKFDQDERTVAKVKFTDRIKASFAPKSNGTFVEQLGIIAEDVVKRVGVPEVLLTDVPNPDFKGAFYNLEEIYAGDGSEGKVGALRVLHWLPNVNTKIHSHELDTAQDASTLKCQFIKLDDHNAVETLYSRDGADQVTLTKARAIVKGVATRDVSTQDDLFIHAFHTGAQGAVTLNVYSAKANTPPKGKCDFVDSAPEATRSYVQNLQKDGASKGYSRG